MTDDQAALREAMEWLEQVGDDGVPASEDDRHRDTLKRRLAMPVMPEGATPEILAVICDALGYHDNESARSIALRIYLPNLQHLAKPATKIVWRVSWGDGRSYDDHFTYDSAIDWLRRHPQTVATTIAPVEVAS